MKAAIVIAVVLAVVGLLVYGVVEAEKPGGGGGAEPQLFTLLNAEPVGPGGVSSDYVDVTGFTKFRFYLRGSATQPNEIGIELHESVDGVSSDIRLFQGSVGADPVNPLSGNFRHLQFRSHYSGTNPPATVSVFLYAIP